MSIYIKSIRAKHLGPLDNFDKELKLINLIYGHNEKGKTYLVEFIYRSLFKNINLPNLRSVSAPGQVVVSGIEANDVVFSPSTRKKLEDFWEINQPGLPRDFSKLLVVRGGELDLASNSPAGLNDQILKDFLSGEVLLDRIGGKINATASTATYDGMRISGAQRAQVKEYNELLDKINDLNQYIEDVNKKISGGRRFELTREIGQLIEQLSWQDHAKRYKAFTLANEIVSLEGEMKEIPAESLDSLERDITRHRESQAKLARKQQELAINQQKAQHFEWLDTVVIEYQKLISTVNPVKMKFGLLWLVLTIVSAISAIALVLFRQPYFGIGMILLAILFGFLYLLRFKKAQANALLGNELDKIEQEFKEKFNYKGQVGSTVLLSKLKELQPVYFSLKPLHDDIDVIINESQNLEREVSRTFRQLIKSEIAIEDWQAKFNEMDQKRSKLDNQSQQLKYDLARLDVAEDLYIETPVYINQNRDDSILVNDPSGQTLRSAQKTALDSDQDHTEDLKQVDYDRSRQTQLTELLKEKEDELDEVEDALENLKQAVCGRTGSNIGIQWEDLIEKLTNERTNLVNKYKDVTASILAQMSVNEVLLDLRKIEESRIEEGLSSPFVTQALLSTTGHYDHIEKVDKEIQVSDKYGQPYKLSDLSTGAREQVLLGLRMGFAAKLLAGETMFLILDDAFQHSDWNRREILVDKMMQLANMGWQIIYFTMDDHIKNLFNEKFGEKFKDQYRFIELNN